MLFSVSYRYTRSVWM